jgi:uncharacterized repeat protein (TIGR01451 family)
MKSSNSHKTLSLVLLLGSILLLPVVAQAGNGTFKNGQYNFCVSVRFNANAAQLQQIRDAFQNASQVLADATDGQHRFGKITIVNNSGASESAEYWVNSGSGRAYATYSQYGVRGQHVMLFFDSNFQGANAGPNGDAYTIAHEHAHHAYGVADEYSGPAGNAECAAPPDTAATNFCLMDNYFTRGGNAGGTTAAGYTLNEFCVTSNHDPDLDTNQQSINGQSCWTTIANHPKRSATAPAGLPVSNPPAAHTVTFHDGTDGLRVILILDHSGSMSIEQRLEFAKQGASQFVDLLGVGDSVGVVSFDDTVSVNFGLTTITGDGTKNSAKAAINGISLGGSTNIGGGLQAGLNQINALADHCCNNVFVLLSDGDHNTGPAPATVIPALQDAGITVLSVGLGAGISTAGQATLQDVASQTGGKFFRVSNAADLVALFTQLSAETTGSGLLARAPEAIGAGQVKEIPVLIEQGSQQATFAVTLVDAADNITVSLRSPSGVQITQADDGVNPNVDFIAGPLSRIFRIQAPEAGTWKIVITAGLITNGNLEVLAFAKHDGVQFSVAVLKDTLTFPEAVQIAATPRFDGEAVVGAVITGVAIRPDGSRIPITMFDDGLPEHADAISGDGNYGNRFDQYNENGTYTFELTALVVGGVTYAGEDLFSFLSPNTNPVSQFTRSSSTTAVLNGVPVGTDLSIDKTGPAGSVLSGSDMTYVLTVTNNGPASAADVTVTDVLPSEVTFKSCNATAGGVCGGAGNNRTITFPSLAAGVSATINLVATVSCPLADGAIVTNKANVTAVTPDPSLGNNTSPTVTTNVSNPPPVISGASVNKTELWPPSHKLVDVTVTYNVDDNCGPVVTTLSVTSNEPVDGLGDGDTAPDWEIVDNHRVRLRAERSGKGSGRIYTITIVAIDSAGQSSSKALIVRVPSSQ